MARHGSAWLGTEYHGSTLGWRGRPFGSGSATATCLSATACFALLCFPPPPPPPPGRPPPLFPTGLAPTRHDTTSRMRTSPAGRVFLFYWFIYFPARVCDMRHATWLESGTLHPPPARLPPGDWLDRYEWCGGGGGLAAELIARCVAFGFGFRLFGVRRRVSAALAACVRALAGCRLLVVGRPGPWLGSRRRRWRRRRRGFGAVLDARTRAARLERRGRRGRFVVSVWPVRGLGLGPGGGRERRWRGRERGSGA